MPDAASTRVPWPPPHIELLIAFANSVDVDEGTDELTSPAALAQWLVQHGLSSRLARATKRDLALALALRSGLHEAFVANHDRTHESQSLISAAAELPLRIGLSAGRPVLRPVHDGLRGSLSELLVAVQSAVADGTWQRLKICADDACEWAYFDASKNQSRSWCEWGCGNRAKTRNYRARQRALR